MNATAIQELRECIMPLKQLFGGLRSFDLKCCPKCGAPCFKMMELHVESNEMTVEN